MISTQIITNNGNTPVTVQDVSLPSSSGMAVHEWFLVGWNDSYPAAWSSPDIPPKPERTTPGVEPGETKRVAVVLKVTSDQTEEAHLTIDYREESGRKGSLTPARRLHAVPHGQECP
ncbi:hypothetical protein I6I18_11575 [Kytococcus sedentarius]|uniref:Uncharacterized protein n=1 Tax=Kytococcus sedentarius (strain ATCC 14392 / DSM 20547 / JCM 11482 / CCUG 33030 / NBRC 15357 / NCTC 11040 / CCM 314 / 541) TaxID=478801 RepID=C7NIU5_KYTSD|nr:hypothetical protein [Kytococcus sedentarius]ACV05170.1 hypothetical protein Ksed_00750 [Kytococcus sedentarius DSM 20547]QQB63637.1 hypothetical protein I6I18_11575 [Kytococcus sedentarius]STX13426.1 Uncharacterised protein [Kytococcus sedentarius]